LPFIALFALAIINWWENVLQMSENLVKNRDIVTTWMKTANGHHMDENCRNEFWAGTFSC
jgi:hypothetical protein